jgi:hypothetical protein
VRRLLTVLVAASAAAGIAAASAGATNECRGLQVCVPIEGPWVVTGGAEVSFQLSCPKRFVVGGLDAELSRRGVDVTFRGRLGSPVNPGITTTSSAVFLARLLVQGHAATFRPHVGCIPAAGGGQRFPTVHRPEQAIVPTAVQVTVTAGVHRYVMHCPAGKRLTRATHAVGFYTDAPPEAALVRSVGVRQTVSGGKVHVVVRAGALEGVNAIVQVDMVCA